MSRSATSGRVRISVAAEGFTAVSNRTFDWFDFVDRSRGGARLKAPIMRLLQGETLMIADVMLLRAYFRQWINAPGFTGPEIERLRAGVDKLVDRATIEAWLEDAIDAGIDPL